MRTSAHSQHVKVSTVFCSESLIWQIHFEFKLQYFCGFIDSKHTTVIKGCGEFWHWKKEKKAFISDSLMTKDLLSVNDNFFLGYNSIQVNFIVYWCGSSISSVFFGVSHLAQRLTHLNRWYLSHNKVVGEHQERPKTHTCCMWVSTIAIALRLAYHFIVHHRTL